MATCTITLELRSDCFTAEEMLLKFKDLLDSHEESLADFFDAAVNSLPEAERQQVIAQLKAIVQKG